MKKEVDPNEYSRVEKYWEKKEFDNIAKKLL